MKRLYRRWSKSWWFFGIHCAAGIVNAVLVIGFGFYWNAIAALLNATFATLAYPTKEYRNGRHRQAQEDPRDPGDGTSAEGTAGNYAIGSLTSYATSTSFASGGLIPSSGTARVYFGGSPSTPPCEVERVQSDMPILAHRIAGLALTGTSKPFRSLNFNGMPFGIDADAECAYRNEIYISFGGSRPKGHAAPDLGCSCGFYALPSDVEPWSEGQAYVTLLVELSGTVIEHERGYRAAHQRVIEVQFDPCPLCHSQAEVLNINTDGAFTSATCRAHALRDERQVEADTASRVLGVPVTFKEGS